MTQEMADIIGTAAGDPGCKIMATGLEEDEPKAYASELFHCIDQVFVCHIGGVLRATEHGVMMRRAAIDAGEVRA